MNLSLWRGGFLGRRGRILKQRNLSNYSKNARL
jgi:hypothetical protein